jgi:PEP-CTERM motif
MRRVVCTVLLALLVVALPVAARADTIDLTNQFGSVTITNSGIFSKGVQLRSMSVNGHQVGSGHTMGSVSFWTGAFTPAQPGGTVFGSGTFAGGQGVSGFVVTGKWGTAKGDKGTIFSGYFVGPIDWTLIASSKFFHEYELTGSLKGQLYNGHMATGTTIQTIYTYWNQEKIDHSGGVHLGGTTLNSTPEPGTLGLLGSGLLAVAGAIRRKISRA